MLCLDLKKYIIFYFCMLFEIRVMLLSVLLIQVVLAFLDKLSRQAKLINVPQDLVGSCTMETI